MTTCRLKFIRLFLYLSYLSISSFYYVLVQFTASNILNLMTLATNGVPLQWHLVLAVSDRLHHCPHYDAPSQSISVSLYTRNVTPVIWFKSPASLFVQVSSQFVFVTPSQVLPAVSGLCEDNKHKCRTCLVMILLANLSYLKSMSIQ